MDFKNLVIAQAINGLPSLANAGAERFKGFEVNGAGNSVCLPPVIACDQRRIYRNEGRGQRAFSK